MPGEKIKFTSDGLSVDGEKLDVPYKVPGGYQEHPQGQYAMDSIYRIPENSYFVLGDNTKRAKDCQCFGALQKSNIIAN